MKKKNKNYFSIDKPYFLAEIGVNHNGSIVRAKQLIKSAKANGASGVKFQTYKAELLADKKTPKVAYQNQSNKENESHYEMLKRLELSENQHKILKNYCDKIKIDFISTPYDVDSAKFLLKLGVPFFKTASADLIDIPLHEFISSSGKPVAISVGMALTKEIEFILNIYNRKSSDVILLHCVSNYPCSNKSLNLNVINTLRNKFFLPVGFSDHSEGFEASMLSVALGCRFFEKHYTLNKNDHGPDHAASAEPQEFKKLVLKVNETIEKLGSPIKKVQKEELSMKKISRKGLKYSREMLVNEILTMKDISLKRPNDGINPLQIYDIIGKKLKINVKKNQSIKKSNFK